MKKLPLIALLTTLTACGMSIKEMDEKFAQTVDNTGRSVCGFFGVDSDKLGESDSQKLDRRIAEEYNKAGSR